MSPPHAVDLLRASTAAAKKRAGELSREKRSETLRADRAQEEVRTRYRQRKQSTLSCRPCAKRLNLLLACGPACAADCLPAFLAAQLFACLAARGELEEQVKRLQTQLRKLSDERSIVREELSVSRAEHRATEKAAQQSVAILQGDRYDVGP